MKMRIRFIEKLFNEFIFLKHHIKITPAKPNFESSSGVSIEKNRLFLFLFGFKTILNTKSQKAFGFHLNASQILDYRYFKAGTQTKVFQRSFGEIPVGTQTQIQLIFSRIFSVKQGHHHRVEGRITSFYFPAVDVLKLGSKAPSLGQFYRSPT